MDPLDLDFGLVPVETRVERTITLSNGGDGEVEVYSTTFLSGDADVWRVDSSGGSILTADQVIVLTVAFSPEDEQVETARLQIRSSDSATGPIVVELSGEGTPSVADEDEDGYSPADGDCNDNRADTYPGAPELCDGRDNNCDEVVPGNEEDDDNDGYRLCDDDCDDDDRDVHPGAEEICDDKDSDCSGDGNQDRADVDQDGQSICDGDCDDSEGLAYPGNTEVCGDGIDNDCSGEVDDIDLDGDGHSTCHPAGDCDDDDENAYPVIVEQGASGGDGTEADPYGSVTVALANLDGTCNAVWIADGTYNVSASLAGKTVTIRGQSEDDTILEGDSGRLFSLTAGSDLTLFALTLADGAPASGDGGAIQLTGSSLDAQHVTFRHNASVGDGGAISANNSTVSLNDVTFDDNEAGDDGGAWAVESGTVVDSGGTYLGNSGILGGAVHVASGSAEIRGAIFDDNDAVGTGSEGGALYVASGSNLIVEQATFWRNSAGGDGGAIALRNLADGLLRNNLFQNNSAGGDGGALHLGGATLPIDVVNNTFYVNNTSTGTGGHLRCETTDATGLRVLSNIGGWANVQVGGAAFVVDRPNIVSDYNLVFGTGINFDVKGSGDLEENPLFTTANDDADPENDDLTLGTSSPAIDSGHPDAAFDDCDGSQNDRGYTGGPGPCPL